MRRMRIVLGLLLAVVMALGISVPALAAAEFTDIEDHDYEASILHLAVRSFIGGYDDGTFRPDNPLQRQQFAKMAVLTLGYEVTAEDVAEFPDTPAPYDPVNNPLYPGAYVAVAAENEIIGGYTNGDFGFVDNVTRQQAITIAVRAAGTALAEPPAEYAGALDYSDPNHGANIKKAEFNGMLAGILGALEEGATWDLAANATRGEAAEILAQLYYRVGKIVKLGTQAGGTLTEYSMAELMAMDATEGYGGWKNKLGNITGPKLYKGVAVKDLIALAGGGTTIKTIAADGYESEFTADEVNGVVTVYDKETGEEIADYSGTLTMILAYSCDGAPLASREGALRIAFVSEEEDQVTDSKKWAGQVIGLVVE
ncbi:MAG: S-layer homology domain-containing protein [Thermoleophilia bacterium]|nr:S-layer homology domain-containing protein [Thermoleophilia bacterium]